MTTCNTTKTERLVKDWTSYAKMVGCSRDTERSYWEIKEYSVGYRQFITQGRMQGISEEHLADCWDLVKLNLLAN
jgi:hypothetical protein